jgi:hypothetical protein
LLQEKNYCEKFPAEMEVDKNLQGARHHVGDGAPQSAVADDEELFFGQLKLVSTIFRISFTS